MGEFIVLLGWGFIAWAVIEAVIDNIVSPPKRKTKVTEPEKPDSVTELISRLRNK